MRYDKYAARFVMLEEQSNVFALRSTLPVKGHVKIETGNSKGAMRVVVQNMRYYERGPYVYKLILFGKKKERTIHSVMGTVAINRYGNGETYIRFNPLDVDGKGNPLSAFSVAIIVAVSVRNEKESLHPILKGDIVTGEGTPAEETESEESAEEEATSEESAEEVALEESPKEEAISEESPKEESHTEESHTEELLVEDYQQDVKVEKRCYNEFYNKYLIESCQRTVQMAGYYDDVVPFQEDKTKARWKKVVNVGSLPVVSPGARYFASQYQHYIFGIAESRCYIGIPGRLMNEEQPDGGHSGFVYWQPIIGAERTRDAYGYWIAGIDMMTGNIEEV